MNEVLMVSALSLACGAMTKPYIFTVDENVEFLFCLWAKRLKKPTMVNVQQVKYALLEELLQRGSVQAVLDFWNNSCE